MKFNSVKEFFFKLYNRGYQFMMIPLILFIFFYSQRYFYPYQYWQVPTEYVPYLPWGIGIGSLIILTIVHYTSSKRTVEISREVGLGIKLEKFGTVLTRKMLLSASVALIQLVGLVLTGDQSFSILFGVMLVWYFFQWPQPARVASWLKLRGDEKEMVISKGEAFK